MAFMKRCKIELLSLGFAAATLALFANRAPSYETNDFSNLSAEQAVAESVLYLEGDVRTARYDRASRRWAVTDGRDVAWLDGRSGALVEIELTPAR